MLPKKLDLLLSKLLGLNKIVPRVLRVHDELIELGLDSYRIPVLRVLKDKHHEEGEYRRDRVDHELPGVTVVKYRTSYGLDDTGRACQHKSQGVPGTHTSRQSE